MSAISGTIGISISAGLLFFFEQTRHKTIETIMDAIIRRKGSQESKNEPKPRKWPRETASNAKFVQLNGWFLNRGSSIWFKAHAAKSWQLLLLYIIKKTGVLRYRKLYSSC